MKNPPGRPKRPTPAENYIIALLEEIAYSGATTNFTKAQYLKNLRRQIVYDQKMRIPAEYAPEEEIA